MKQIIVYDIPDDVTRTRVSHILEDFGYTRLQYSVFVGARTQNTLEELSLVILDIIKDNEADIRVFQICEKCERKIMVVSRIGIDVDLEVMFPCP